MNRLRIFLLLAGTVMLLDNTAVAQQPFDGSWSVEAVPEKGICTKVQRYKVVIGSGVLRSSGRERVGVSGGLEAGGNIRGSVQRNKIRVHVTGKLSGPLGSGDWTLAGG
jgi:hypothetical protein